MSVQERNALIESCFKGIAGVDNVAYCALPTYARAVKEGVDGKVYWKASMEKGLDMEDRPPAKIESLDVFTTIGDGTQPNVLTSIDLRYDWSGTPSVGDRIKKAVEAQETIRSIIDGREKNYRKLERLTVAKSIAMNDIEGSGVYAQIGYSDNLPLVLAKNLGSMIVEMSKVEVSTHIDGRMREVIPCLDLQTKMFREALK
jgi:hypothetical protein